MTLEIALKTTIPQQAADLHFELFPVQSPLLRESYSFSFPPLTYMLKFSGYSCFSRCTDKNLVDELNEARLIRCR